MSQYRYQTQALKADYGRSLVGVALTGGPLILSNSHPGVTAVLAALAAVFLIYGLRTARRHGTRICLDEAGIRAEGWKRASIRWNELRGLKLKYYSTHRDSTSGWMQLRLLGKDQAIISVESSLEGFKDIVAFAVGEACACKLSLAAATLDNLKILGIRPGTEQPQYPTS